MSRARLGSKRTAAEPAHESATTIRAKICAKAFIHTYKSSYWKRILPNKRGDVEEERRGAFVAASRAMKILFLTYSRMYIGKQVKRSTFLDEMIKG